MLLLSFTSLASAKNILIFPSGNDEVVINTTKVEISAKGQEEDRKSVGRERVC